MNESDFHKKFIFGDAGSGIKKISSKIAFWSVFIGSMALIISLSVLEGFDLKLHDSAFKFDSHIKLTTFDREVIQNYSSVRSKITSSIKIKNIEPVIENYALYQSKERTDGILVKGVSKKYFSSRDLGIERSINSGEILVSRSFASKNSIIEGDKITLFTLNDENVKVKSFQVVSFYDTGFSKLDDNVIFSAFDDARELFKMPQNSCTQVELDLYDPYKASEIALSLDEILGWPFYAQSVFDLHAAMFNWIKIQKTPIPMILGIISLVAAFNVITSLLITVVEKYKEIGILRCLGMRKDQIMKLIIRGGLSIGLKGMIYGQLVGLILLLIQKNFELIELPSDIYFVRSVPVEIVPEHILLISLSIVLISIIASIIPSIIALKFTPMDTIRDH